MSGPLNFLRFTQDFKYYFEIIGFELSENASKWHGIWLIVGLINMNWFLFCEILFCLKTENKKDFTAAITFVNYFLVGNGKIISMWYYRKTLIGLCGKLRLLYPSEDVERMYDLGKFLNEMLIIVRLLSAFNWGVVVIYNMFPLAYSIVEYVMTSEFTYRTTLYMWYSLGSKSHWAVYLLIYALQVHSSYTVALMILATDLCLFGYLLQLCMHFDLLSKVILEIEPNGSLRDEERMIAVVTRHVRVLRLYEEVNKIFTPSVLFSLLSSSFIICFTGFQMIGNVSIIFIIKALLLLAFEMKQVIITCYLGDKLILASNQVRQAAYHHEWYNGSLRYKKIILMVLMRTNKSCGLRIAGISDVSLQSLREVMSISYQFFTLLKSTAV